MPLPISKAPDSMPCSLVLARCGASDQREILETARLSWRKRGIPVEEIRAEPAAVISLAAELASAGLVWCILRLTDHPEWETASFNRLEGVRAAQVFRVEGMARAIKTLKPQVLVTDGRGATVYEIIRFGADLWQANRLGISENRSNGSAAN